MYNIIYIYYARTYCSKYVKKGEIVIKLLQEMLIFTINAQYYDCMQVWLHFYSLYYDVCDLGKKKIQIIKYILQEQDNNMYIIYSNYALL